MTYEHVAAWPRRAVGLRQSQKAVERGEAVRVVVAQDAEERRLAPLIRLCRERGVPLDWIGEMGLLGQACGIAVGTAAVALLKEA